MKPITDVLPVLTHRSATLLRELTAVFIDKVKHLLSALPAKLSPLDFLPTKLLKMHSNFFTPICTNLTKLFGTGWFPTAFKAAQMKTTSREAKHG